MRAAHLQETKLEIVPVLDSFALPNNPGAAKSVKQPSINAIRYNALGTIRQIGI